MEKRTGKSEFHLVQTPLAEFVPFRSGKAACLYYPTSFPSIPEVYPRISCLATLPTGGPSYAAIDRSRADARGASRASPGHGPPGCGGHSPPYAPRSQLPDTGAGNRVDCSGGAIRSR